MGYSKNTGVKSFMLIISFAVLASSSLAAESNVTTLAPITIAPNPPVPDPKPALTEQELNFHIMDKDNVICALFSFIGSIYLPATSSPKANETTIPLSNLTTKNPASSCDKNRTSLVLNINGDVAQNLNLTLYHTDSNYQLNIITLNLANKSTYLFNDTLFSVDDGKSYICSANPQVELVNQNKEETKKANLQLRKLKVDAFRTANGTDYRYAIECDADFPSNDFVPLAVGCALIALVFIVLVAYIVGRRRSRRLTYQSV